MARFETTRWSLVLATREDAPHAREALAHLCQVYRSPVLAFVRRSGYTREEAEDLTQGFFVRFIENAYHAQADPARGRFRTFLLTAVQHYVANCREREHAIKRGGNRMHESIDAAPLDLSDDARDAPERVFERAWALAVIAQALAGLRSEADKAGKLAWFERLQEFVTEQPDEDDYARVAGELGVSRNTLAVAVRRLRLRLRALVRLELAQTVSEPAELEEELRVLRQVLGGKR